MAIYHLSAKVVSRGKGQSAIAAAAYRSGERLEDEQTGEQKFYEQRARRIVFTDIMAPKHAPEWAHDRNRLWNEAERAEKRKDAQLAREIEVSLPHELTDEQRVWLIKDFAREAFVRHGYAVDIAIHQPDRGGDGRNHHAHLMIAMRVLGPDGFSPTKDRSLNAPEQLEAWREQWAQLANRHLERHGHDARVDHRSLEAQGIDREATTHVGYAGSEIAARGAQSDRRDAFDAVLERNGIRLALRTTDAELAQLHALAANENEEFRAAPGRLRERRTMLDGPTDEELKQQPEREKAYLDHLQQRHERAQAVLAEQQRSQELDDRAKAFQQARELEVEEGRKKKAAQEAEAGDGRNGDISSAAARYSIAIGEHYDVRDPYASLARAAGAESAMFHRNQEKLRAEAAAESDPDKRQALELRRRIEGCDYMAITSERLAGISVAVTGRDDNATAVADRQQAAHYRAMAGALREERASVLEAIATREAGANEQLAARVDHALASHQARRNGRSDVAQDLPPAARESTARPTPRAVVEATMPEPATPAAPTISKDTTPEQLAAQVNELAFSDLRERRAARTGAKDQTPSATPETLRRPGIQEAAPAAQPQKDHGADRPTGQGTMPPPSQPHHRDEPPAPAPITLAPTGRLSSTWKMIVERQKAPAASTAEPAKAPVEPQAAQQDGRPAEASLPPPSRPDYRSLQATPPAELRVLDEHGKDAGPLSAFMQREQPQAAEPYRPLPMSVLLNDNRAWKRHTMAQFRELETVENAEQALGRLGSSLEKGRTVQAEDLRSLTREQWDGVRTKGEAGLVHQVREAKERGAQDHGRGMGDGPPKRDW